MRTSPSSRCDTAIAAPAMNSRRPSRLPAARGGRVFFASHDARTCPAAARPRSLRTTVQSYLLLCTSSQVSGRRRPTSSRISGSALLMPTNVVREPSPMRAPVTYGSSGSSRSSNCTGSTIGMRKRALPSRSRSPVSRISPRLMVFQPLPRAASMLRRTDQRCSSQQSANEPSENHTRKISFSPCG